MPKGITKVSNMTSFSTEALRIFELQKAYSYTLKNSTHQERIKRLQTFKEAIVAHKTDISSAIFRDLGRDSLETDIIELMPVLSEINLIIKSLQDWMKPKMVKTPLLYSGTKSWISYEARGTTLIISPWNYPFQLVIYPVLSAIAAGNAVCMKLSEFTPNINQVIKKIVQKSFPEKEVTVFEGEAKEAQILLDLPFDHIFFTGSTNVGKIVMKKAAEHLSSVTLELGGKCPAIIDENTDIEVITQRIAWGKYINAGQTCLAPDYIMVHENVLNAFMDSFKTHLNDFTQNKERASKVINLQHFKRLKNLFDDAIKLGAKVEMGGEFLESQQAIQPTIMTNVTPQMLIMQEEIFGPILPVMTFRRLEEVTEFVNSLTRPLALYVFSKNQNFVHEVVSQTHSGGVTINDVILHMANHHLPFGGNGHSGQGCYHGHFGFLEFSHQRAVLQRNVDLGTSYFYPPYTDSKKKLVATVIEKFSKLL
ncbi:MAG: aldehyde dehydrogenase family protein [Bacteriovoracaceae bacterium]|nr:aldehyde dehydrogenase family protein [Bacteriovoracaceae bacterium]